jgi:peptidoglycan/LPS O-acetylase OafA/YrhL
MMSSHRPDLEGLRGIAILLVVLFHAGIPGFEGAFVGVDLFLVLSGYFITRLLLDRYERTGEVPLVEFWGTRAARLLPSVFLLLAATLAMTFVLFAPIDRPRVAEYVRAVALFAANSEFASESVNYFHAGENPVLHLWTLSLEQQFYFVWPVLLAIGVVALARPAGGGELRPSRAPLVGVVGAVLVLSLLLSAWTSAREPSWAFFGLHTRLWELAAGGVLAFAPPFAAAQARIGGVLQVVGLGAVGLAVISYDSLTPYPGTAAMLPAAGTLLVIVGGSLGATGVAGSILQLPMLRTLGNLSFAWYLWHWPLLTIAKVLDPETGATGRLLWAGASLLPAWATHHWLEQPMRVGSQRRWSGQQLAGWALAASVTLAFAAHGLLVAGARAVDRSPAHRRYAAARADRLQHPCWAQDYATASSTCAFGDRSARTSIVLLGDSHAEHWLAALDRAGQQRGWKIIPLVNGGCPVADVRRSIRQRAQQRTRSCDAYRESRIREILAQRPSAVILSSWDQYVAADGERPLPVQVPVAEWRTGLRRTYGRFARSGITTIVLRGTPRTWFDVPACLSRRAARLPYASDCRYERSRLDTPAARAQTEAVEGLALRVVDLNDQICASRSCTVERGDIVLFTDDNHLTATFSRSLAPVVGARVSAALATRVELATR